MRLAKCANTPDEAQARAIVALRERARQDGREPTPLNIDDMRGRSTAAAWILQEFTLGEARSSHLRMRAGTLAR